MSKAQARLYTHREVARLVGISTEVLRRWVGRGSFPRPHSAVEATWFYPVEAVDEYLATGKWPESASYNRAPRR